MGGVAEGGRSEGTNQIRPVRLHRTLRFYIRAQTREARLSQPSRLWASFNGLSKPSGKLGEAQPASHWIESVHSEFEALVVVVVNGRIQRVVATP